MSSYVDNLSAIGDTLEGAISILEDAEAHLEHQWGLQIKPSSRSCLVPRNGPSARTNPSKWPLVTTLECLGHQIQDNGETNQTWLDIKSLIWRSFFVNCKSKEANQLTPTEKTTVMTKAVYPRLAYKTAPMPLTNTRLKQVDTEQRRMVCSTLRARMAADEEIQGFCRRRNRAATVQMKKMGLWSDKLCKRAVQWHEHIVRDTAGNLWSKKLLGLRDEQWLQQRRLTLATVSNQHRTSTRLIHGHVAQRWFSGVLLAKTRANPGRDEGA